MLLGNACVTDESEAEESALIQGPEHGGTGPIRTGAQELGHIIILALREIHLRGAHPETLYSEFAI